MDGLNCMATRGREFEIDLERGGSTSEEDSTNEPDSTAKAHTRKTFSGFGCFDGYVNRGCSFASCSNSTKSCKLGIDENEELLMDKSLEGEKRREQVVLLEKKKRVKEVIKKTGRVHKPPRPPKGPSLDAADRILVKEITDLALKRRASVERIKALKRMKAEKGSSFTSSLPALFITLLFFVVIIFQGMSAKGSTMLSESPVPSVGGSEGFISIQNSKSPDKVNGPDSRFLNFAEVPASDLGSVGDLRLREDLKKH